MDSLSAVVLSHFQVRHLRGAFEAGGSRRQVSPDLGLSSVDIELSEKGAAFPGGGLLTWHAAQEIVESENNCYILAGGEIQKIMVFSETTGRVYSLMPTTGAPTMLISGIPMHRIKDTEPHQDTLQKIAALKPLVGQALDTATGLGYTAIEASRTADRVTTIELDPAALEIARCNPWSRQLFDNPKITQLIGDSFDVVESLKPESFTRILHDPPAFALAGHLYSSDFYELLFRVLRRKGRLFHYIGNPESKSGHTVTAGVVRRLKQAGFLDIRPWPQAFGVVASKNA